jgi:large subunit ribosomal protein L22
MPGPKANEREGTRAVLRHFGTSAFKVREVLDLVRGAPVNEAADLLRSLQRGPAVAVYKLLQSAVANASNNGHLDPEELYVSACYADEGPTAKRWRPRARGRATRARKRSCHVTVIVSRLPEQELARLRARRRAENLAMRARRVEATRRARAEAGTGASRRERRHPEAYPQAPEEAPAETVAAEQAGGPQPAPSGEAEAQNEAEAESEAVAQGEAEARSEAEVQGPTDETGVANAAEAQGEEGVPEEGKPQEGKPQEGKGN